MRELRVEDALMYLDQVKMEFGDRPHIYNEFLDIMKTFKSQQIDTPGVIQRVSALFHGNKRLVLGFNTFLPEGYKIELPLDGSGLAVYREPGRREAVQITWPGMAQHLAAQQRERPANAATTADTTSKAATGSVNPVATKAATSPAAPGAGAPVPPSRPVAAAAPPPPRPPPINPQPAAGGQHVEFGHAINYVTTIKKRFASHPEIYRKFLEILHTYQKEQRGIKEVLDEVSLLFADHADLLKEFTYFLPDAVQDVAKKQLDEAAKLAEERVRLRGAGVKIPHVTTTAATTTAVANKEGGRGAPTINAPSAKPAETTSSPPLPTMTTTTTEEISQQRIPAAHVKKVPFGATKGRSENEEMEIRKSAINGIVSFDPVRPPRRNELTPAQAAHVYGRPKAIPHNPIERSTLECEFFENVKAHFDRKDIFPDAPAANSKTGIRKQSPYTEFIKCIHLFGVGILNHNELVQLLRSLLIQGSTKTGTGQSSSSSSNANPSAVKHANLLLADFDKVLLGRGPYAAQEARKNKSKSKYGSHPLREYDVSESSSRNVSPSYWSYPTDYVFDTFSGESEKDAKVLNFECFCMAKDYWMEKGSGGVGGAGKVVSSKSIEDYDGVKARHNVHEGVLNRVEDEMYEVDITIERNLLTMRLLEPTADEMAELREQEEKAGQPIGRLQYNLKTRSLNSIHIGAIARVYGDSGDEVIQHLLRNPLVVIPIVHQRMKEKDVEWRKARDDLMKEWKAAMSQHYYGSLDVKSYFYKIELEKSVCDDVLIKECQGSIAPHQLDIQHVEFRNSPYPEMSISQPYLLLVLPKFIPHEQIYDLLASHVTSVNALSRVWNDFVAPWFGFPSMEESNSKTSPIRYNPGQQVKTTMGDGKILSVHEGSNSSTLRYRVKFPFGVGYVRPHAIAQILSTETSVPEDSARPFPLQDDRQLLFGTESIYIFLRLYLFLANVLSNLKDIVDPSEYTTLLALVMKQRYDLTEFETRCRKIAGISGAHMFLSIPFLVKKCTNALSRVADEDYFVRLSHLSQLQLNNPNVLRSLSLKVTEEAVYHIQMTSNQMFFNYFFSMEAAAGATEPEQKRQKTDAMTD